MFKNVTTYMKYRLVEDIFENYFVEYRIVYEQNSYRFQGKRLYAFGILYKWVFLDSNGRARGNISGSDYENDTQSAESTMDRFITRSQTQLGKLPIAKIHKTYTVKTKETHPEAFV